MTADPIFNAQNYAETIKAEVLQRDKTIFSSTFSVDGDYLICGSSNGSIAVWYLPKYFVSRVWRFFFFEGFISHDQPKINFLNYRTQKIRIILLRGNKSLIILIQKNIYDFFVTIFFDSEPDFVFKAFDGAVYCLESIIIQHNIILLR